MPKLLLLACLLLSLAAPVRADTPVTPEQSAFFTTKIKPLLEAHCFKCHSHVTGKSKNNLVVDSRGALLRGGDSGPAIVPGHPEKSLLLDAVRHAGDLRMPPGRKLPAEDIALLETWIRRGAPWVGAAKEIARQPGKLTEADRRYWAFQPPAKIEPPTSDDAAWSKNPVDRFVRTRLQTAGLKPSPPADRTALLRRVYFDLVGLPPLPQDLDAFLTDTSPDAYEKLIDRLLASPRYGEHWARHWLDLVRFAESDGYRADAFRPHAWRYRDYVVKAFNADKPYDRFLQEQLAGDEMFPGDPEALTATGYLRLGIYEFNQRDVRTQWQTILDDITDVTGEAILGLGMGCARCHDHKFDPILQKDYYRLQAFFAAIQPHDLPVADAAQLKDYETRLARWLDKTASIRKQIDALEHPERAKAEHEAIEKFPPDIKAMLRQPEAERSPLAKQLAALAYRQVTFEFDRLDKQWSGEKKGKIADLRRELARFEADKPAPPAIAMVVRDVGPDGPPVFLPKRIKGTPIEPGFLSAIDEAPAAVTPSPKLGTTGRRTALARWLTRTDNPLTARVLVNRLWQYHFGQGLVNTPSDFGRLGEKPSHPELLDYLARRFVDDGWSIKKMHRLLVTSVAYRQSATAPASELALKKDPHNRLVWRASTRRLQAEQIRDALLAVTGRLDLTLGGPSVDAAQPRRTIYVKTLRNTRDALLDVFDAPENITSTGQRNITTTPTQALLMINSPFMLQQSKALADRLRKENPTSDESALQSAFRLLFARSATDDELRATTRFLEQQRRRASEGTALEDLCHVLLNANEFLYVD